MVVTIVEGAAGEAINATEETDSSQGGVFKETSVLATKEVGLVINESRSITGVGVLEQITNSKSEVAGTGDVIGMETCSLVDSSWSTVCSLVGTVEDVASSLTIKSPMGKG